MKILYIFPHPDDESFGPAPAMAAQLRKGADVYLLTLTKGEATKKRHDFNLSKEEMGEVRYGEMKCVKKVLGLTGMTVLNLPDGELKWMDPFEIEQAIEQQIRKIVPDVIVTYAVHGISGFHDHLVCHAVVKNLFCRLKREGETYPRRLAFFTRSGDVIKDGKFRLEASSADEIAWTERCNRADMDQFNSALDCYETYQDIIEASKVREVTTNKVPFEIFGESFDQPLSSLTDQLK